MTAPTITFDVVIAGQELETLHEWSAPKGEAGIRLFVQDGGLHMCSAEYPDESSVHLADVPAMTAPTITPAQFDEAAAWNEALDKWVADHSEDGVSDSYVKGYLTRARIAHTREQELLGRISELETDVSRWKRDVRFVKQNAADLTAQLAAAQAQLAGRQGEAIAWLTDDGERVVTARTMHRARKDGGAVLSGLSAFTTPCFAQAPPAQSATVPERLIAELEAEANAWWQGKKVTQMRRAAAQGALTILGKLRERIAAAPQLISKKDKT